MKLKSIRLIEDDGRYELIFDFDNNWHMSTSIKKGIDLVDVMKYLRALHNAMEDENDKMRRDKK